MFQIVMFHFLLGLYFANIFYFAAFPSYTAVLGFCQKFSRQKVFQYKQVSTQINNIAIVLLPVCSALLYH